MLIITTDHGRDAATGRNHGGQSERERSGWIVTNAKQLNDYFKHGSASIADIMPAIASFLHVSIPREQQMEVDGIPITGALSAIDLKAHYEKGKIHIQWKAVEKTGNAKIWLAATNNFKMGGKDTYQLVAELPLKKEQADIDVSKISSKFYKIVIETPHNMLNRWIVLNE